MLQEANAAKFPRLGASKPSKEQKKKKERKRQKARLSRQYHLEGPSMILHDPNHNMPPSLIWAIGYSCRIGK